jgi:putative flippase GtrA
MQSMPERLAAPRGLSGHPLVQRALNSQDFIMQVSRYGLVSVVCLACDFVIFLALTKAGVLAALAGAAGYIFGLALHFVLSTMLVFDATRSQKSMRRLFAEFAASGGIGLILTAGIITIMLGRLHATPSMAKLSAVVVSFAVVFLLRRTLVFAARTNH